MKKKRLIIFLVFLLFGVALFVQIILRTGVEQIWSTLKHFSFVYFLIFLGLSCLNFALFTLRWKLILKHLHKKEVLRNGSDSRFLPLDSKKIVLMVPETG